MDIDELHRVVVQGFASVSDRFDSVDARIDELRSDLVGRIETLEAAVRKNSTSIESLEMAVTHHGVEIRALRAELTSFRHDFDHREELERLRALETRVTTIEASLATRR